MTGLVQFVHGLSTHRKSLINGQSADLMNLATGLFRGAPTQSLVLPQTIPAAIRVVAMEAKERNTAESTPTLIALAAHFGFPGGSR